MNLFDSIKACDGERSSRHLSPDEVHQVAEFIREWESEKRDDTATQARIERLSRVAAAALDGDSDPERLLRAIDAALEGLRPGDIEEARDTEPAPGMEFGAEFIKHVNEQANKAIADAVEKLSFEPHLADNVRATHDPETGDIHVEAKGGD